MAEVELDDVNKLRAELQSLHEQKTVVNERLNAWNGGRGRGRGLPPHDGAYGRAPGGQPRRDDRAPGPSGRLSESYRGRTNSAYQGPASFSNGARRPTEPAVQVLHGALVVHSSGTR